MRRRGLEGKSTDERVVVTDRDQHLPYDALLIASGGWANPLQVPGAAGVKHIYNFVTLDDTKTIIARMLESRTALAYGGSFISYELCDGFAVRKLDTTWLMRGPIWLRTCLDAEGGEVVDNIAKKFGVEVIHGDEIETVVPQNGVPAYVKTRKGRQIQVDLIGVGLIDRKRPVVLQFDFEPQATSVPAESAIVNVRASFVRAYLRRHPQS